MPFTLEESLNFLVLGFLEQESTASVEIKKGRYRKMVWMLMRDPNVIEIQTVYVMGIVMK